MKRRGNREGTIYRENDRWVAEATWTDGQGTHRRRRRRKTQHEAREALVRLKAEISDGVVITGDRAKLTVAEVMKTYLAEAERRVTSRTLKDYVKISARAIVPALGNIRAHALRRSDIVGMLKQINGDRSKQFAYVITKAALSAHVRHVDPTEHPFPPRSVPRIKRREHIPWTAQQLAEFLKAIEGDRYELLYRLALASGLRQSEILGLRWLDVRDASIIVREKLDEYSRKLSATKTVESRRSVEIPRILVGELLKHREQMRAKGLSTAESSYVFLNEAGRPIIASNLRRSWRLLRDRLDLPSIRLYDLRHAHATHLALAGVHPLAVSRRLGHSSVRLTLDTYSHVMPEMEAGAVAAAASLLGVIGETKNARRR